MSTRSWFSRSLAPWYRAHGRDLPWRRTRDPYRIWLSEVILQQTRVDQGTAYYERFVEQYPTVADLASAPEGAVMKLWQGLGYYSRARNLMAAARQVVQEHGGTFPSTFPELLKLKGVGDYTAAAIASIVFDRPEAVVDGNVYRVLARVFGIDTPIDSTEGRKAFRELANSLLDPSNAGDHNQSVMELGATVCLPRNPACGDCPLASRCIARKEGRIDRLPVKAGKTKVRDRYFHYLIIRSGGRIWLHQRTEKDIWRDLYQPPLVETTSAATKAQVARRATDLLGYQPILEALAGPVRHVLSHQVIHARFWTVLGSELIAVPEGWVLVGPTELKDHAVPRLIERFLEVPDGPDLFS
ncbi:MAG: A/G-specific adenine glycosylase [Flavobacteriales bacterium]|nr:A/G-specific adenine glycosylase [Flavobacteriales bacterium]